MPATKKPAESPTKRQPKSSGRPPLKICIVTRELYGWSEATDAIATTVGMAQNFAAQGETVTLLSVPPYDSADNAPISKLSDYLFNNYLIKLEVLTSCRDFLPALWGHEKASAAVYYHLKEQKFDVVYFAIEGGLAYYSLLAKELGLFEPRPILNILVTAPTAWQASANQHFLENLAQVTSAYMERYCVEQADNIICASSYILDWMKQEGWQVTKNILTLPSLRPFEWQYSNHGKTSHHSEKRITELVFFSGPEFNKGLPLFCDTLDALAKQQTGTLTVTLLGRFGRILGEHTAGMVLRRSRRWPFALKIMPRLTDQQVVEYLRTRPCLAVIPRSMANCPLDIATCLDEGIPFVATAVGGIPEMIGETDLGRVLGQAKPSSIAERIAALLKSPSPAQPRVPIQDRLALWNNHLEETARAPKLVKQKAAKDSTGKNPFVSIVMVHHDRPEYLMQAIEAVENQDYPNYELILVDDGSVLVESHKALDGLKKRFAERGWKILRQENKYLGAARNAGVRAARGDRILFVDDDNALFRHALSTFVKAMDASGADICTAFQRIFHEDFIPADEKFGLIHYFPLGGSLDLGLIHDTFGDANAMIRRSVFDKIGFQLEDYGYTAQDWEFYSRATLAGLKLRIIPEPLYWYRLSEQGMYRTSHWYKNRLPILAAFRKHGFTGLEHIYHLVLAANVTEAEREGYRENLRYNLSDQRHLHLAKLDPESDEAIELLAEIAAAEGRADTSLILLGRSKSPDFRQRAGDSLDIRERADRSLVQEGHEFTAETLVDHHSLREFTITSSDNQDLAPLSYVEGQDRLFLQARPASMSVAVMAAGCPPGTVFVSSIVWLDQVIFSPTEFLILLVPIGTDPLLAVSRATQQPGEGVSGWQEVAHAFKTRQIEARFSLPSSKPCNIVLAVRNKDSTSPNATLGCFSWVTISKSLGAETRHRPRLGAPLRQQRAREWSNEERLTAKLVTDYPNPLPLILFPSHEEGIFLRPSNAGKVVATLPWAFPPFARRVIAKVEIAHEDASPFEFAMALSRPEEVMQWTGDAPVNCLAFSGWLKVERKFELHQLVMDIREQVRTHLSISLAVRLPKGSQPSPANSYWRKLLLVWDE